MNCTSIHSQPPTPNSQLPSTIITPIHILTQHCMAFSSSTDSCPTSVSHICGQSPYTPSRFERRRRAPFRFQLLVPHPLAPWAPHTVYPPLSFPLHIELLSLFFLLSDSSSLIAWSHQERQEGSQVNVGCVPERNPKTIFGSKFRGPVVGL